MSDQPAATRVYKYPLMSIGDWVSVTMPEGAEVLCVQMQYRTPCLWARVTVGAPPVTHHFRIAGTGHDLDEKVGKYIGTFQVDNGTLVFHVFAEAT